MNKVSKTVSQLSGWNFNGIPFQSIENDYRVKDAVLYEPSKVIQVLNTFDDTERRLIILYAENDGSFRKMSKAINICPRTLQKYLKPIIEKYKKRLETWQ